MSAATTSGVAPLVEVGRRGAGRVSRTLRAPCTIRVGSSSACDLRVVARGVRARHLALDWDGRTLTVVAEPGAGPVHHEGRTLRPPFVVSGGCTKLEIGDASVCVSLPESPEDEPTLVMDRDRTEVPPPRSDDPTEISERPQLPIDATTTQRVRHHRSRLDAVCGPIERAEGRVRQAAEGTRRWLSRFGLALASSVVIMGLALFVSLSRRHAARPVVPAASSAHEPGPLPVPSVVPSAGAPPDSARTPEQGSTAKMILVMPPAAAARLLASGRRHEARDAYAALSKMRPDEPIFGVLARILAREQRVAASAQLAREASP